MESVEIAKLRPDQTVTLEFGNKEVILTKLEEPRKFKMEDWFEDEAEIYILEDVIEEDEPLHYSLEPCDDPVKLLNKNKDLFGVKSGVRDFLGRVVGGIEMEEEEEEEEEKEE
ncbi:MAG: hypothetical protein HQL78_11830 [Magnetococcales bacterium]|nr:hypothetical protein [Magnetococcales bacterium]MBF0420841.1 hypothetical protein [Magnetococcales bacterium]